MSIYQHYLETAGNLIDKYDNCIPFHLYLKQFFSLHKKYGSRDRKHISAFCFSFFRFGHAFTGIPINEKLLLTYYLISSESSPMLQVLNPEYNKSVALPITEKIKIAGVQFSYKDIFPFYDLLSNKLTGDDYTISMLHQPDLFLRIRPKMETVVTNKMKQLEWNFSVEENGAVRLPNSLNIEKEFQINREIVIQDLNSQQVGIVISNCFKLNHFLPTQVWDCCAASGGKSIMLYDLFPGIKITVSDIRPSIIRNLEKRFDEAGIKAASKFVADLSGKVPRSVIKHIDFIIADVPCSGSGTWSRTPEQLYYFKEESARSYAARQKSIANNLIGFLKPGGWLVYITCSVFKCENEEVVTFLQETGKLKLVHQELLDGTKIKADSMFVAILKREK